LNRSKRSGPNEGIEKRLFERSGTNQFLTRSFSSKTPFFSLLIMNLINTSAANEKAYKKQAIRNWDVQQGFGDGDGHLPACDWV
jgi:preprotein translocase subunit SecG